MRQTPYSEDRALQSLLRQIEGQAQREADAFVETRGLRAYCRALSARLTRLEIRLQLAGIPEVEALLQRSFHPQTYEPLRLKSDRGPEGAD